MGKFGAQDVTKLAHLYCGLIMSAATRRDVHTCMCDSNQPRLFLFCPHSTSRANLPNWPDLLPRPSRGGLIKLHADFLTVHVRCRLSHSAWPSDRRGSEVHVPDAALRDQTRVDPPLREFVKTPAILSHGRRLPPSSPSASRLKERKARSQAFARKAWDTTLGPKAIIARRPHRTILC